jgi:hypothetical protein
MLIFLIIDKRDFSMRYAFCRGYGARRGEYEEFSSKKISVPGKKHVSWKNLPSKKISWRKRWD